MVFLLINSMGQSCFFIVFLLPATKKSLLPHHKKSLAKTIKPYQNHKTYIHFLHRLVWFCVFEMQVFCGAVRLWGMKKLIIFWGVLFLIACNPDKNTPIDKNKPSFTTSVSSEMFFRNLRQVYYHQILLPDGREQFRMRSMSTDTSQPQINLCLIADWKKDRAYIFIEPHAGFGDTLKVRWYHGDSTGQYQYVAGPVEEHFRFATEIYTSIQKQHRLEAYHNGQWKPAFPLGYAYFRKTMVDFYRLVGLL